MEFKTCTTCKTQKSIIFYNWRKDTNSFRNECQSCRREKEKLNRANKPKSARYLFGLENKELKKAGKRKCYVCQTIKIIETDYHKGANASCCKECKRAYYLTIKDKVIKRNKEKYYQVTYGITREELGTCCEICTKSSDLVIDHCHFTGKVRGLLCRQCNVALGLFKDDSILITKVLEYLNAFKNKQRDGSSS